MWIWFDTCWFVPIHSVYSSFFWRVPLPLPPKWTNWMKRYSQCRLQLKGRLFWYRPYPKSMGWFKMGVHRLMFWQIVANFQCVSLEVRKTLKTDIQQIETCSCSVLFVTFVLKLFIRLWRRSFLVGDLAVRISDNDWGNESEPRTRDCPMES